MVHHNHMMPFLEFLDFFEQVSGLKISFTKTKWVGSAAKMFNGCISYLSIKFSFDILNFEHLGITFTVALDKEEDLNYLPKFSEIRKLLNQ